MPGVTRLQWDTGPEIAGIKPFVKQESLLVLDMHKAQRTEDIKSVLEKECKITPIFVPAGCTSIVQPLDVSFNAPFKRSVESAVMQHIQENLEGYLNGKFTAGERRILFTKWVGQAWEELSQDHTIAMRAFKKCGISVAADGSEDHEINLTGLEEYRPSQATISELEDPFDSDSDADSNTCTSEESSEED